MAKKQPAKLNVRLDKIASLLVREAAKTAIRSNANEASAALREYYTQKNAKPISATQ